MYGLRHGLEQIRDRRQSPRIPTMRVVTGLFLTLCLRIGSLNGIDQALRKSVRRTRWHQWMGGDLPSADRLGEVAALVELDDVRTLLYEHHRLRKRKKTLKTLHGGLRVLILDGHEIGTSYLRCCEECLTREISCKDQTRIQYYHRYVLAYLLCEDGHLLLDLEMQQQEEGEISAATRLLKRLLKTVPRAFNVVAGDALYLDPTLCKLVLRHNKDFVAVLKNENRDLIKDFRGVATLEEHKSVRLAHNDKQCECHDIEGFTSWSQLDAEVRVLQSIETSTVRRQRTKKIETCTTEWMWATSLSKKRANTSMLLRIGHSRWDIENPGFNELVNQWHADHVFHHQKNAIAAILLLLFLAYNIFHAWLDRGIKPQVRNRYTAMYLAKLIAAEFYCALHPT